MKLALYLLPLVLASCAAWDDAPPAPRKACPEAPLMRADQTTRSYALQLLDMYNDCRDGINHAATPR